MKAVPAELPRPVLRAIGAMFPPVESVVAPDGPPQNLKEYDPEWGRSFVSGLATAGCDYATMLANVKVPVLFTHHYHELDEESGTELGAISDKQATRARDLVAAAGRALTYSNFPSMPHSMHGYEPELFTTTVLEWAATLPAEVS